MTRTSARPLKDAPGIRSIGSSTFVKMLQNLMWYSLIKKCDTRITKQHIRYTTFLDKTQYFSRFGIPAIDVCGFCRQQISLLSLVKFQCEKQTVITNLKKDGVLMKNCNGFFKVSQSILNNCKRLVMKKMPKEYHVADQVDKRYLIRFSYIEIYNEKINDLLDKSNQGLTIREDIKGNVLLDAREAVVDNVDQVMENMMQSNKIRRVAATRMNERSSRSHTIFRIILESKDANQKDGPVHISYLNLMDLAGSERVSLTKAAGERLKEGANINKSLSVLGNVIRQLSEGFGIPAIDVCGFCRQQISLLSLVKFQCEKQTVITNLKKDGVLMKNCNGFFKVSQSILNNCKRLVMKKMPKEYVTASKMTAGKFDRFSFNVLLRQHCIGK
ncbi:unnamed protein product [Acanthoscelides obtectus]|uniref:Kinesin motor domain-containing protein n=1 Tax=Acanthoscelides obtectus TaxID=200917 RepID=A0A9P0QF66_ACAOB|nr:unnamed protein product [Acanthoscelides obtectus]CAK1689051.1 Centromere-associated protein E [Acanthoscelides obtectus]